MIAIITGNFIQYSRWCRDNGYRPYGKEVLYVTPLALRGCKISQVVRVGTWYQRHDLGEIHDLLPLSLIESEDQ